MLAFWLRTVPSLIGLSSSAPTTSSSLYFPAPFLHTPRKVGSHSKPKRRLGGSGGEEQDGYHAWDRTRWSLRLLPRLARSGNRRDPRRRGWGSAKRRRGMFCGSECPRRQPKRTGMESGKGGGGDVPPLWAAFRLFAIVVPPRGVLAKGPAASGHLALSPLSAISTSPAEPGHLPWP